jgi:hypothetical protein
MTTPSKTKAGGIKFTNDSLPNEKAAGKHAAKLEKGLSNEERTLRQPTEAKAPVDSGAS